MPLKDEILKDKRYSKTKEFSRSGRDFFSEQEHTDKRLYRAKKQSAGLGPSVDSSAKSVMTRKKKVQAKVTRTGKGMAKILSLEKLLGNRSF